MDVVEGVKGLMLDSLDPDFVDSVWDEEFMGEAELPDDYEEHVQRNGGRVIDEIIEAVDSWQCIDPEDPNEDKTWKALNELNLDPKPLMAVLWHLITNGGRNKNDPEARYVSFRASVLYFKLLAVSGSRVYHAFHPYLCLKAVSVLKFGTLITPKNKKSKKRSGKEQLGMFASDLEEIRLNARESVRVSKELISVLQALQSFIMKFSMQSDQELLEEIIERLAEISRLEVNSSNFMTYRNLNRSDMDVVVTTLSYSAYECLKLLCIPQHGDVEDTVIVIMKYLLPGILMSDNDLTFRELCTVREHAVHFVKYLFSVLGEVTVRGVIVLIHNIFTKIGEKSDIRQKGKESIVNIMQVLPNKQYKDLVKWLFDCAHCDRASYRLLALEVIAQLLFDYNQPAESDHSSAAVSTRPTSENVNHSTCNEDEEEGNENRHNNEASEERQEGIDLSQNDMLHKYMLAVIFARCRDSSGSVRTKALTLLVQCMNSDNMVVCSLMNEIFVLNPTEVNEKGFLSYKQLLAALKKESAMDPLPGASVILSELKNLACDCKVFVRKAALQALEAVMKLNRSWLTGNILKMMGKCCQDPAVSIRKEIVQILSDLLQRYPDDKELIKVWAKCVVPLVFDQEGKLQECVLKAMRLMIMENLRQYGQQQDDVWSSLPWQLLSHIVQFNHHICLTKACEMWVKSKELRNTLVKDVCSHVATENNLTAWIVLYCLSLHMDFKNPMFALDYYRQAVSSNEHSMSLLVIVLEVLLSCSAYLPHDVQEELLEELITSLSTFTVPRELIRLNIEIAMDLTYHLEKSKKLAAKKIKEWTGDLLELCQVYLEDTFQLEAVKALDGEQFVRHLHTLGEVAIHNPREIRVKTFHLLQRYLFLPERNSIGSLSCIPVAKPLTVVAVGKLCLLNQIWAQETTKPLVKLLNSTQDLPTLLNVMYVLRDLCVRYGAVMEPHLPSLWMCLKDAATEVRFTALTCLVELLQSNYIKFRGAMFFHILSMICDPDDNIVELATYFFQDYLIPTNKNIMFEHMIDALFHYNGYKGHDVYGKISMTREEREKFLMKGDHFRKEREHLYAFMLDHMEDEQRMQTKSNLVIKVLDGAAEGHIRLDLDGESVILDAIKVLNSKHIHLRALQQQEREDDAATDNVEKVTNVFLKARNKAIAECEKTHMIEQIVPVVIHLKAVLQERYSRLVPHLMEYLRDMMKYYKNEVKEIFAEDKQTAEEILFDITELERRERRSVDAIQEESSNRATEDIPPRVDSLLQNASLWVRQSIGPEIIRCFKTGGEEMMVRYARAKLRRLREKSRRESSCVRPSIQSITEMNEDLIEPKEEDVSDKDDDDDVIDYIRRRASAERENCNLQGSENQEDNPDEILQDRYDTDDESHRRGILDGDGIYSENNLDEVAVAVGVNDVVTHSTHGEEILVNDEQGVYSRGKKHSDKEDCVSEIEGAVTRVVLAEVHRDCDYDEQCSEHQVNKNALESDDHCEDGTGRGYDGGVNSQFADDIISDKISESRSDNERIQEDPLDSSCQQTNKRISDARNICAKKRKTKHATSTPTKTTDSDLSSGISSVCSSGSSARTIVNNR